MLKLSWIWPAGSPSGHLISFSCVCAHLLSRVQLFATPWTAACQVPLSMGMSMGMLQARILGWVANSYSRASSWPRNWIRVSGISCTGTQVPHHWKAPFPTLRVSFQTVRNLALMIPDTFTYLLNKHIHLMSPTFSSFQPLLCILPLYLPAHCPPASKAGDSAPGREKVSCIFNVSL